MQKYDTLEQVYGSFVDALQNGQSPDVSVHLQRCSPADREELEADLRVAEFMFENHFCLEVSDASIKKAQDAILKLRRTEDRLNAARAKLSSLVREAVQSPAERVASALGIFIDSVKSVPRPAAVFARGDSSTVAGSRAADRMQYRAWRKRGMDAAESLVIEANVTSHPIDLNLICDHLNLLVSTEPENSAIEGYLVTDGEVGGIVINSLIGNPRKRRFTLAHEIGHFILHKDKRSYVQQDTADTLDRPGDSSDEAEANSFAGALLMPVALLGRDTTATEPDMDLVEEVSDDYDVSFCAAAHRVATISDWPCAFVLSHNGTIEWTAYSEYFSGYVRGKRSVDPNSAADAVSSASAGRTLSLELPQSVWLEGSSAPGLQLIEHSRNMGDGYVYSILVMRDN